MAFFRKQDPVMPVGTAIMRFLTRHKPGLIPWPPMWTDHYNNTQEKYIDPIRRPFLNQNNDADDGNDDEETNNPKP